MIFNVNLKFNSTYFLVLLGFVLLLKVPCFAESKNDRLDNNNRIVEERFIRINGIEQWVTIKGDATKPVILFLHGGPGSPLSPYSDSIYGDWEKDFVLVQWDQRGTGKTYGRDAPAELDPVYLQSNPLTVDQMTTDGVELTEYLIKYLKKEKVILFGTSWGSVLGVQLAIRRPDLFYAYVGHSQVVTPSHTLRFAYDKVYTMAEKANDKRSIHILDSIANPPYDVAQNSGRLLRIIKKYERENSLPAPMKWLSLSPAYDNERDNRHREEGDDYSFVNYVGDKRLAVKPMISTINLLKDGLEFKVPVFLMQGEEDILTPKEITEAYFNKIKAPSKKLIVLPKTAHGFNLSVVQTQYTIMKDYIMIK